MADINISQKEGDALIAMPKFRADDKTWKFPIEGGQINIPLISEDKREQFLLDVTKRGRIDLTKGSYQNRARVAIILVRLDFDGRRHKNPDDEIIESPHIHLYREGFGHKWANPVPAEIFTNFTDFSLTLQQFMKYCNIVQPPEFGDSFVF